MISLNKAWKDLKSFVTVAMIIILGIIVLADLLGATLTDNVLILFTNLVTAVFTYYFTKKDEKEEQDEKQDS